MLPQSVDQLSFDFFPQIPVVVQRQDGAMTSDAGLIPLRQFDARWRYTQRLAACVQDQRPIPRHTLLEMTRQRLYGILAGYEDCNDHDTLREDPLLKLVADRGLDDDPLASQPTLSRFENSVTIPALHRLIDFLADTGVERLREKHQGQLPERVTLDLDPTDDPTHGHQQLSLFHGYYDQHQYFPQVISEPTTRHVFLVWLRPGAVHAAHGADDDLMRVVGKLRAARADVAVHVRGDCGFGVPWMYDICEKTPKITYTFGLAANTVLQRIAQPLMDRAVAQFEQTKVKQRLFMAFEYQAESWDHPRIVIAKVECHAVGTNLRFIVTNIPTVGEEQAQERYDDYIQRGTSEQRMDELKNGLSMDRLSCHRFMANFWRLLLHTAAYNLLNAVRDHADLPALLRDGQPCTWRTHLIKVAATIVRSTRRVLVLIAGQWPWWRLYEQVSSRCLYAAIPAGP